MIQAAKIIGTGLGLATKTPVVSFNIKAGLGIASNKSFSSSSIYNTDNNESQGDFSQRRTWVSTDNNVGTLERVKSHIYKVVDHVVTVEEEVLESYNLNATEKSAVSEALTKVRNNTQELLNKIESLDKNDPSSVGEAKRIGAAVFNEMEGLKDSVDSITDKAELKPEYRSSLLDDYADPSQEPGDFTGGDD